MRPYPMWRHKIALHPRDNDDEGWRIQDVTGGAEMTLAEARKQSDEKARRKTRRALAGNPPVGGRICCG